MMDDLISRQPDVPDINVGDTISRQQAIDAMCELMHHWFGGDPKDEIREIKRELVRLPSAQPDQNAQERYEDLCEYFKDCLDKGMGILGDRKEFKAWLERVHWHVVTCDELGRELEKLKSAQPEKPEQSESAREYCAECNHIEVCRYYPYEGCDFRSLPSAQPEPLTDKEQRIFLASMEREKKVCKQVDKECRDCREPYEDSLVRTCHEIIRKVKGALWT